VLQKTKKILIVDDEEDVTDLLEYNLKSEGYLVKAINDPLMIMGAAKELQPDLILLDVMMPDLSGIQICRMLRADSQMEKIPIVFLTAKGEVEDRVAGLEAGADDYICKPFDMREVKLRVSTLLKRSVVASKAIDKSGKIRISTVEIDPVEYKVTSDGEEVKLTITEFNLLYLLMSRRGRVQTREHILVSVWQYESDLETRTIDTHVRRLRQKLGDKNDIIETVRGVGYRIKDV
jgi:two-component system, OmpR family, phosphate regulon response regulator PhoB